MTFCNQHRGLDIKLGNSEQRGNALEADSQEGTFADANDFFEKPNLGS
jgi:hypothetical protein